MCDRAESKLVHAADVVFTGQEFRCPIRDGAFQLFPFSLVCGRKRKSVQPREFESGYLQNAVCVYEEMFGSEAGMRNAVTVRMVQCFRSAAAFFRILRRSV
jgi:hypothetical protein